MPTLNFCIRVQFIWYLKLYLSKEVLFSPLRNWYYGNSEDSDELPHDAALPRDLHCL